MEIKGLKNHFLVSMPSINDPIFKRSIILICRDTKEGSMGLIINKPIDNILKTNPMLETNLEDTYPKGSKIYFGGPVGLNIGCVLHESTYQTDKTLNISKELSLTSDKKIIKDIRKNNGPDNFMFALGYAGWDRGQLISEIENGDWLLMPADIDFIFSVPDKDKWKSAATQFGVDISALGGSAGIA